MADYDSDLSPAAPLSPTLSPQTPLLGGGGGEGGQSNSVSPDVERVRSPTVLQGGVPRSPVTTGRIRRSRSLRKLLQSPSPDPSPSRGQERRPGSLALKRPSFLACEDENSCDSGYASLPAEELKSKRVRFQADEDPSLKENVVDNWFSGLGAVGPSPSPSSLSFKSNTSSLDLDGFPAETIPEVGEEEGGEGRPPATAGFTSLLSNSLLDWQPRLRRHNSMSNPGPQLSSLHQPPPPPPPPQSGFKMPSVPLRQAGPVTRSMLKTQNENRKRLVELKEDMPDVLPDGSK